MTVPLSLRPSDHIVSTGTSEVFISEMLAQRAPISHNHALGGPVTMNYLVGERVLLRHDAAAKGFASRHVSRGGNP